MEKLKEYKYIILIGLIVLGIAFYWYALRPSQLKKECDGYAREMVNYDLKVYTGTTQGVYYDWQKENDKYYKSCLREKGLN